MSRPRPDRLLAAAPTARPALTWLGMIGIASGVTALGSALSLAWAVTRVVENGPILGPLMTLAVLLAARGGLAATGEYAARRAGHKVSSAVRVGVLRGWLAVPAEQRPSPDASMTLIGGGVNAIEPYVSRYLPSLVSAVVVPALSVVTLLVIDPWSALIVVLTLPLLPLFAALIGLHTRDQTQSRRTAMTQLSGHFLDVVRGLPTLVSYGRAQRQREVVSELGERHRVASVQTLRTAFLSTAALELLATISVAMVAVGVGLRLAYGAVDLQVALTAILLAPEAYWPIRRMGVEFHNAADGAQALEDLHEHLGAAPVQRAGETGGEHPQSRVAGLDDVSYSYPGGTHVFDHLTLAAPSTTGLTVLTGPSGCGKSTVLELLAGLRTPQAGSAHCPAAHMATQRPLLLAGTVLENLRLGAPEAGEHSARGALISVDLWADLERRDGLDTVLGDDGFGLSAGQRSRLALARACLSEARVVLLDEPTAHIATAALPQIHSALSELARTRRVIVATHDPDVVALADSRWTLSTPAIDPLGGLDPVRAEETPSRPDGTSTAAPALPEPAWWQRMRPMARLRLACALGGSSVASGVALTATSGWLIVQASFQPVVLTLLVAIVGVRTFGLARPLLRYAERVVSHDVALSDLSRKRTEVFTALIPLTPARLGPGSRGDVLTAVVRDLDDVIDEQVRFTVPAASALIATTVAVLVVGLTLPWAGLFVTLGAIAAATIGALVYIAEAPAQVAAVAARGSVLRAATTLTGRMTEIQAVAGGLTSPMIEKVQAEQQRESTAETVLIQARAYGIAVAWVVVAATSVGVAALAANALSAGALGAPMAALVALTPMALADSWVGIPEVCGAKARARAARGRLDRSLRQTPAVIDRASGESEDSDLSRSITPLALEEVSARWAARPPSAGPPSPSDRRLCALDLRPLTLGPLHRGDRIQLTGPNGAGKSTALAVLARHLDPTSGHYRMGNADALAVSVAAVQAKIAIVDDEPHAFAGSVRANLALARPEAPDEAMVRALHTVGLERWLIGLPAGLDNPVVGLSGGERTRLSIARAVLSGRPIVLLDEPTAHLDDASAQRAINALCADRGDSTPTVVAVSHRPLPWTGFDTVEIGRELSVAFDPSFP